MRNSLKLQERENWNTKHFTPFRSAQFLQAFYFNTLTCKPRLQGYCRTQLENRNSKLDLLLPFECANRKHVKAQVAKELKACNHSDGNQLKTSWSDMTPRSFLTLQHSFCNTLHETNSLSEFILPRILKRDYFFRCCTCRTQARRFPFPVAEFTSVACGWPHMQKADATEMTSLINWRTGSGLNQGQ